MLPGLMAVLSGSVSTLAARHLLVGGYGTQLTTLTFDPAAGTLVQSGADTGSSPSPTWQTLFKSAGSKYILSVSEVYDNRNDKVTVSLVDKNAGTVSLLSSSAMSAVLAGPVSVDATRDGLLAVASYGGGGLQIFKMNPSTGQLTNIQPSQTIVFTLSSPGPVSGRQDTSHPHQALFDPTNKYLLVPDLGADMVRIYSVDSANARITEQSPMLTPPGSGPRHGVFGSINPYTGQPRFYYVVNELANRVDVLKVGYESTGLRFTPVQNISTYPTGTVPNVSPVPTAGEIAISADNKFLYVSNRGDKTFPNATTGPSSSSGTIVSDSIAMYSISPTNGTLTAVELTPAGGVAPRHFSLDPTNGGRYVAVVTQSSGRVTIYKRELRTGKLGTVPVASIAFPSTSMARDPSCVTWLD
ncbi:Lactonase, 7-bladed beta-propeller-domain-containing protein [Kalaharituber pfeilii]|nr:Lactonase, 7-bladed beta-propeller-domain-containing protein [Kalaharituber pfeilii]